MQKRWATAHRDLGIRMTGSTCVLDRVDHFRRPLIRVAAFVESGFKDGERGSNF